MKKEMAKKPLESSILTASLLLALSLILSCSNDESSGNGGGNEGTIKKASISGVSQKGPFVKGSAAILYELNKDLSQTGRIFQDIIADDRGSFEIKGVELVSPYALLKVEGYYRNEVTGQVSAAPITLYAIADVSDRDNVNVNLLTHLEYRRVMKLAEGGKSIREAKKQAQREILAVFGISGDFMDSEDMSIFGSGEGDAALLAISVLLQRNLSEGNFSEQLSAFSLEFAEDGVWENESAKAAMAYWASNIDYEIQYCMYEGPANCWRMPTNDMCQSGRLVSSCSNTMAEAMTESEFIRNNILAWGLSENVPAFEKYVREIWSRYYGLEECTEDRESYLTRDNDGMNYVCESGSWHRISEFEADTYGWNCKEGAPYCVAECTEGEIKVGNVSGHDYICEFRDYCAWCDLGGETVWWEKRE